jgi:hypothetical protein
LILFPTFFIPSNSFLKNPSPIVISYSTNAIFIEDEMRSYNQQSGGYHFGGDAVQSFGSYKNWISKNSGRRHF